MSTHTMAARGAPRFEHHYTDAGEVLDRVTSVKINGLTVEQALYRLVTSPGYQNLSPRRTGIRGEEKDSQRLVEVYKIYKEYNVPVTLYAECKKHLESNIKNDYSKLQEFLDELPQKNKV